MNFNYLQKFLDHTKKFRLSKKPRVLKQHLYDVELILNLDIIQNVRSNLENIKTRIIDRLTQVENEKCVYKNNNINQNNIDAVIALICMLKINNHLINGPNN